jgi:hypothetical protein
MEDLRVRVERAVAGGDYVPVLASCALQSPLELLE